MFRVVFNIIHLNKITAASFIIKGNITLTRGLILKAD